MNVLPLRPYAAPFWLRNGHLQTFLASSGFRARGANPMREAARDVILEAGGGIRLLGSHSRHPATVPKGLVVLLHGWEGSIDSTYMLCTGRALYRRGYEVFRLNFRDHGRSHHLNRGIFYAVLLDEVFEAVTQVAAAAAGLNVFLAGFSLGGNFALRIARRCATHPIPNLRQVVAVSAALDPEVSTARADRHPLIRRYFLKKWRRSLAIKQQLFPDLYDFSDILRLQTLRAITDALVERYSHYPSAARLLPGLHPHRRCAAIDCRAHRAPDGAGRPHHPGAGLSRTPGERTDVRRGRTAWRTQRISRRTAASQPL